MRLKTRISQLLLLIAGMLCMGSSRPAVAEDFTAQWKELKGYLEIPPEKEAAITASFLQVNDIISLGLNDGLKNKTPKKRPDLTNMIFEYNGRTFIWRDTAPASDTSVICPYADKKPGRPIVRFVP